MLTQEAEIDSLKTTIKNHEASIETLKAELDKKDVFISELTERLRRKSHLSVTTILERKNLKGLFKFYTGLTYVRFCALLAFLMPAGFSLKYESNRQDIQDLTNQDCLLLVLCRLRQNYFLKDLAMRFGLTLQSSGAVFNAWVKHMYLKLGQLSIWPHRDVIIRNMPQEYKSEFPTTLVIIDGTEIRTQTPCALGLQSQCYSDYKSSTTLKCLIGCDPNGSITFVSELFTGAISDKSISEESGFYELLKELIQKGYVKKGDAVMADKGFTIEKELTELGLKLNIPPHASSSCQMSAADTELTQKIAKHRIHIERLIAKVKKFRIVAHTIPMNLFQTINQIWSVVCLLTLFQDTFVKDKEN